MHHLLAIWPRVKKLLPEAELHIYYDMAGWFNTVDTVRQEQKWILNTAPRADQVRAGLKATESLGVFTHGGIGQWELAREQQRASLMVYPCDPISPTEGYSISVLEALAAGTPVLTSDADAFPELWSGVTQQIPLPFEGRQEHWVEAIVALLTDKKQWLAASKKGLAHAKKFQWQDIGESYAAMLEEAVKVKAQQDGLVTQEQAEHHLTDKKQEKMGRIAARMAVDHDLIALGEVPTPASS